MTTVIEEVTYEEVEPPRIAWGWTLVAGIAWIVIGLAILSWNPTTIALIAILVSGVVILAGIAEFGLAFMSPGWKWLHAIAGVVFLVVGVMAFFDPFRTFVGLALLFGWYLVIKGTVLLDRFPRHARAGHAVGSRRRRRAPRFRDRRVGDRRARPVRLAVGVVDRHRCISSRDRRHRRVLPRPVRPMSARTSNIERKHSMRRTISYVVVAALVAVLAAGCSQRLRAERDGRDLAEAVCDLRDATTADAQQSAMADINKEIDDLGHRYGSATAEDRRDIQENLADLAEHSVQGNEVLIEQDLAVLKRSVQNVRADADDVQESAWNGFAEGIQECATD